jgi:hypothetical protein
MSKPTTLLLVILLAMVTGGAALASVASVKTPTEYDILRLIPKDRLRSLIGESRPDEQGFVGTNHRVGKWIEAGTQRGSCRVVIYGVVTDDLATADDGWRGIEATFAHQREDGGFEANERPNGASARPFGAAVETSYFFLQELGRTILLIRQSPHEAHFRARIAKLEPKIRLAMSFVLSGYDTIITNSTHSINRVVIAAKAFGLCGVVLKDQRLIDSSRKLIAHALTRRDQDGVFLEKGGRDSSYNVVSILFGQVLALHLPIPDFEAALPKAVAWQLTKIRDNGEVDVTGNTRTGVGAEKSYFGEPKEVNYGEVVQALTLYGLVRGEKAPLAAAERVFAFWQARRSAPKQE